jgi:hypothetical protein
VSDRRTKIAPASSAFLVWLFTDLRDDLKERMRNGGKSGPDPEQSGRELAIYEALLAGLAQGGAFPEDEAVREYVTGLAMAADKENEYERVALEHQAFSELAEALGVDEIDIRS